jgi:hypothetical protein
MLNEPDWRGLSLARKRSFHKWESLGLAKIEEIVPWWWSGGKFSFYPRPRDRTTRPGNAATLHTTSCSSAGGAQSISGKNGRKKVRAASKSERPQYMVLRAHLTRSIRMHARLIMVHMIHHATQMQSNTQ